MEQEICPAGIFVRGRCGFSAFAGYNFDSVRRQAYCRAASASLRVQPTTKNREVKIVDIIASKPPITVDLNSCDLEPIHIPGSIQPHGALVVCRTSDLQITHFSDSAEAILGISSGELLGSAVGSLFLEHETVARQAQLLSEASDGSPVYLFTFQVRGAQGKFGAIAHLSGELLFLEFEPAAVEGFHSPSDLHRIFQRSVVRLQQSVSVDRICAVCAQEVRSISGFDRVMVYRFDAQWNGQVVAEERREDLEPFLGLHYPAADIPQQARDLYAKNWLRFICDVSYVPSPVLTLPVYSTRPLDMSFSVLRSVSPIHIEYLRNMGVGASMSISLMHDGRLWGLIACHHDSPRFVPYDVRTACQLLGQMMSLHLDSAQRREVIEDRRAMVNVQESILANLESSGDTAKALVDSVPNMLAMIDSDGAAVVVGGQIHRIGQVPGDQDIRRLSHWLDRTGAADVFSSDNLPADVGSIWVGSGASGVLAVSVPTQPVHLLLWFRTELVRTVNWAGDPAKTAIEVGGELRLSPRGSFSAWKQTVKGRSKPWTLAEVEVAHLLKDGMSQRLLRLLRLHGVERERTLDGERSARSEAERVGRLKDEFVATLSHELRTPLNAILGWAQILAGTVGLDEEVAEGIEVIERNARSQAQMIEDLLDESRIVSGKLRVEMKETDLPAVIAAAIATVSLAAVAKDIRIERSIDLMIGLQTTGDAGRLQQVAWNLLSNAVKFTPKHGRVRVGLARVESHVELSVSDDGQGIAPQFLPHVFERFRQADASTTRRHGGLGLGLSIVRDLVELHGGHVRAESAGTGRGATFVVSLPVRAIRLPPTSADSGQPVTADYPTPGLDGVKVLVVDDELDARRLVKRILADCHCQVTLAGSKDDALTALQTDKFDVIVSDIGMPCGDGFELIREWRDIETKTHAVKTPAIALTAYARTEDRQRVILAGYQAHVPKPVGAGELVAIVASFSGRVR